MICALANNNWASLLNPIGSIGPILIDTINHVKRTISSVCTTVVLLASATVNICILVSVEDSNGPITLPSNHRSAGLIGRESFMLEPQPTANLHIAAHR